MASGMAQPLPELEKRFPGIVALPTSYILDADARIVQAIEKLYAAMLSRFDGVFDVPRASMRQMPAIDARAIRTGATPPIPNPDAPLENFHIAEMAFDDFVSGSLRNALGRAHEARARAEQSAQSLAVSHALVTALAAAHTQEDVTRAIFEKGFEALGAKTMLISRVVEPGALEAETARGLEARGHALLWRLRPWSNPQAVQVTADGLREAASDASGEGAPAAP